MKYSEMDEVKVMSKIGIEIIEGLKEECLNGYRRQLDKIKATAESDRNEVERFMDELMSFGDDERFVSIYRELRHAVAKQHPYLVYVYDQIFDEMWNEDLTTIKFKVNNELYWSAKEILEKQGIDIKVATVIFIKEIVARGDLPFPYTKEDIAEANNLTEKGG